MFGVLTRAYRRRLAISQEELAERTGLSSRSIRAIETGRSAAPRPGTVRLLADAFGLTDQERRDYYAGALGGAGPVEPPGPVEPRARTVSVPHGLPLAVPVFAGRSEYLDRLTALLDDGRPGVVVISGTAGVGKSTLAVHWAHQIADRFPDGQLFVNLQGFGPSQAEVGAGEAIQGFLRSLEVPAQRIPADLTGQVALYRTVLASRRVLVVADNARDADQVRPLIPGNPDCLVLITSRRALASLVTAEGAVPVPLALPTVDESRQLLIGRLGARRVAAEPKAVEALIERSARLPLALSVIAARAALNPGFALATVAEQLDSAGNQLDRLHGSDAVTDLRTVFSWSYRQLGRAARLFRLLGLHPGPDIGVPAAASLTGGSESDARATLAELAGSSLITETTPGRYVLHDLMRSYAGELADTEESPADRTAAVRRMLDHYVHTSYAADRLLAPHLDPFGIEAAAAGTAIVALADQHEAIAWFGTEIASLLAVTRLAADSGCDTELWQLASSLDTFLHRRGRWPEAVDMHRRAVRATERLGAQWPLAHSHQLLGRALVNMDPDAARPFLELAYTRFRALGRTSAAARTQQIIGISYEKQDDPVSAMPHVQLALDLATSVGDAFLRGRFLNGLGWLHALLGDYAEAHVHCRQALTLMAETGDDDGAADAWDSIGFALHHLGDLAGAVRCYEQALLLYRALGHRHYLALTLTHLGETHRAAGHPDLAREVWQDALDIFTALNRPDADGVRDLLADLTGAGGARR